jgi:hypothetical protein
MARLGRQDKSAGRGRAHVVGLIKFLRQLPNTSAIRFCRNINDINDPSAIRWLAALEQPCLIELLQYDNYMS